MVSGFFDIIRNESTGQNDCALDFFSSYSIFHSDVDWIVFVALFFSSVLTHTYVSKRGTHLKMTESY